MSANPFGVRGQHPPDEFAEWNHRQRVARGAYVRKTATPLPKTIPCNCGGMFATDQGLRIHRGQHCKLRAS